MKTVQVILAFHAHEPLWDLPRRLIRGAPDRRIAASVLPESYIRRRFKEGRNVYRDLVSFAEGLGISVSLDATNELLYQIRRYGPGTFRELARAYREGMIAPVYTCAHHTHPTLLGTDELLDEIRLNREMLHDVLGAPQPRKPGLFFTECSVEGRHVQAVEQAGIAWVFTPELDATRSSFRVIPTFADVAHRLFRLGTRLVGMPRHFEVSQEIWRPLTLRDPDRVKYQGFLVGEEAVFHDEYRGGPRAAPRPHAPGAAEEYAQVLRRAIAGAPDGGLLVYLQDLELMDFGEAALATLRDAWRIVLAEGTTQVVFVTPEKVLEAIDDLDDLPLVEIGQMSWAPEIRPALRSDGHYPPRHAGSFRGFNADEEIWRPWPFVFWEPGRFVTAVLDWLLQAFGFERTVRATAGTLVTEEYQIDRFPVRVRLPLLARLAKRACNYGWYPEEGLNKRPFLDGYLIVEALRLELELRQGRPGQVQGGLPPWAFPGLMRLPELIIDTRIEYLRFGLERWREERGADAEPALLELEHARAMRRLAHEELLAAADAYDRIEEEASLISWRDLLERLAGYMKAVFLSLDHLQRAWGRSDADFLIVPMYRFLYDLHPPRLPTILHELMQRYDFAPTTDPVSVVQAHGNLALSELNESRL